jgi:hypothetical protein
MRLIKITLVALLLFTPVFTILSVEKATALSGSDFQAGRIIDDEIFYNNDSMSTQEIQIFLESKVPNCDTDGTQPYAGTTRAAYGTSRGYPPPYICLKDFTQATTAFDAQANICNEYGGDIKTSAEVIKDVADACGINPQVLIVMLEREQSLITDDSPWERQYQYAMGVGCPDSAPCNPEFIGFSNQVYNAAKLFKRYATYPQWFNIRAGQNNYITYHPNPSCGGSDVFIENQATANLYNFNPYQPNQASLDSFDGTGDSCSTYGNRNFWRLFNEWFGSTLVQSIAPTVSFEVNGQEDSTTIDYDSTVTLSWSSENATSCDVQPGGYTDLSNTLIFYGITENTTYSISCTGPGGDVLDDVEVTVLPPTFDYLQQNLAYIGNESDTNVKGIEQQINNATRFYEKGNVARATQSLNLAKDSISRLLDQGKIFPHEGNKLMNAIDALIASWS